MRSNQLLLKMLLVVFGTLSVLWSAGAAGGGLSQAEFDRLHKELAPRKDEAWRGLPWRTSILDARESAVLLKRPVYNAGP